MADENNTGLIKNRKAFHEYEILEHLEAGIALTGTEVKSCRAHTIQLLDAYAMVKDGECWLLNAHIAEYKQGNIYNHTPTRARRLLLHKSEIRKLAAAVGQKGCTLIPLGMYLKRGRVKVTIGVCRGKTQADKRQTMKKREVTRTIQQAIRSANR